MIYHPDHNLPPSQMPVAHWRLVVDLWTRRFRELCRDIRTSSMYSSSKTRGWRSASPCRIRTGRFTRFRLFRPWRERAGRGGGKRGMPLLPDPGRRAADGRRMVAQNESFVAFVPFFARWPAEIQIYSRAPLRNAARHDGAESRRSGCHHQHGAPEVRSPVRLSHAADDDAAAESGKGGACLFSLPRRVLSHPAQRHKIKYLAGVESGCGTFLNDTVAEETSRRFAGG